MGRRVRNEELGESKEMVRYLLTLVHQWLGELLAEDVDIDKLGQFTSALILKLCPEGIDRCECANKKRTLYGRSFNFEIELEAWNQGSKLGKSIKRKRKQYSAYMARASGTL